MARRGFVLKGLACKRGERCLCIHEKDPMKWSLPTLKNWADLVLTNAKLNWDPSVNVAAITARLTGGTQPAPAAPTT